MELNSHLHESILVLIGVIIGTVFTCTGCVLGAYLVKQTYLEITNPYPNKVVLKLDKDEIDNRTQSESYDLDQYYDYFK